MPKTKEKLAESTAQFLEGIVQKHYSFSQHLDNQVNIIVGVSTAIFLFSLSRFLGGEGNAPLLVLSVFSGVTLFVGLFAIHPPAIMRKRGQEESISYNKKIASYKTSKEYWKALREVLDDKEEIIRQYATETYNVSKFYYRPKRKLFHLARNILVYGILITLVTFVIELVI
jgi:preprotein translocase subunit Sss1